MGINEAGILNQAKKGQGETNQRLDELIEQQKITNQWLARIAQVLEAQQQAAQAQIQREAAQYQAGGAVYPQQPGRW